MFCYIASKALIIFEYDLCVFMKMIIAYKHIDKYELIYLFRIVLELIFQRQSVAMSKGGNLFGVGVVLRLRLNTYLKPSTHIDS
jgi:hypothetical protein